MLLNIIKRLYLDCVDLFVCLITEICTSLRQINLICGTRVCTTNQEILDHHTHLNRLTMFYTVCLETKSFLFPTSCNVFNFFYNFVHSVISTQSMFITIYNLQKLQQNMSSLTISNKYSWVRRKGKKLKLICM